MVIGCLILININVPKYNPNGTRTIGAQAEAAQAWRLERESEQSSTQAKPKELSRRKTHGGFSSAAATNPCLLCSDLPWTRPVHQPQEVRHALPRRAHAMTPPRRRADPSPSPSPSSPPPLLSRLRSAASNLLVSRRAASPPRTLSRAFRRAPRPRRRRRGAWSKRSSSFR